MEQENLLDDCLDEYNETLDKRKCWVFRCFCSLCFLLMVLIDSSFQMSINGLEILPIVSFGLYFVEIKCFEKYLEWNK